jgi:hypothetical protein
MGTQHFQTVHNCKRTLRRKKKGTDNPKRVNVNTERFVIERRRNIVHAAFSRDLGLGFDFGLVGSEWTNERPRVAWPPLSKNSERCFPSSSSYSSSISRCTTVLDVIKMPLSRCTQELTITKGGQAHAYTPENYAPHDSSQHSPASHYLPTPHASASTKAPSADLPWTSFAARARDRGRRGLASSWRAS